MSVSLIRLDSADLFKDEAAAKHVAEMFRVAFERNEMPTVVVNGITFTAVSNEAMKGLLYERLGRAVAKNPALLEKLRDRLENDPIVE